MTSRVSMAMVAARAGVSGQTVSRVVNDSPRVDPRTRERVERAMSELDYRPHRAARALRTGRSHNLGLVVTTLATVGNSRMLQSVVETAEDQGYGITVVTVRDDLADAFDRLRDQGVDGAIVLNEATAMLREDEVSHGLPVILIDAPAASRYPSVQSDHAGGTRVAVDRLLALGHRTVQHVAGPVGSFASVERERGWREALTHRGIDVPPVIRGDWSADSGYAAAEKLLSATAIVCANDQMALGVIRGLADLGKDVPGDVSVIGFDDLPDAANYRPPLTTLRQDFPALAEAAVRLLLAQLGGDVDASDGFVPTRLIERASITAAR